MMMGFFERKNALLIKFAPTPIPLPNSQKSFLKKKSKASPTITKMTASDHPEVNEITVSVEKPLIFLKRL
jgi:hypothetical protein